MAVQPQMELLAGLMATPMEALQGAVEKTLPRLLYALRNYLNMDVAFVSEFAGGERVFRYVDAADSVQGPRVGHGDPLDETYCQRIVDGRLPELINDAAIEPAAAVLDVTSRLSIGAYMGVPLYRADGGVYGTLCCYSATPDHSLNERDLGMLKVVAEMTSELIHHELESHREELDISRDIQRVLEGDAMSMVFQPIMELEGKAAVGYEALARFRSGAMDTESCFDNAVRVGRDLELELCAIAMALEHLDSLPPACYLSINLSADTLVSEELKTLLEDAPLSCLVLEITERAPIMRYEQLQKSLAYYRSRGARVAVDDAGAGYASFRHILVLEPDLIKLDKTLVNDLDRDESKRELACALIQFANKTGSTLVAEGVETAEELAALKGMGVVLGQGYYLGRPGALHH